MMRYLIYKHLLISLILVSTPVQAQEWYFSSGQQQTVLIELYTSEGCNSCPPAEEYLNGLRRHPELWQRYIPVAFHVDYWDYIGWRDPYADPAYANRQSWYARQRNLRSVYTPAFVVNGQVWRRGRFGSKPPDSHKMAGELKVRVSGEQLNAEFTSVVPVAGKLTLNIAVLGMDLLSRIMAGENEGRSARHDFVVLGYESHSSMNSRWMTKLPSLAFSGAKHYALAVWVSHEGDPAPLQAVGGDLPGFYQK